MRHRVASTDEVPLESLKRVVVDDHELCLAHAEDDGFYAIDDICTHEHFLLSQGELWGMEVECPAHGSRFDLRTGDVRFLPAVIPTNTYPVTVENGDVYVDV